MNPENNSQLPIQQPTCGTPNFPEPDYTDEDVFIFNNIRALADSISARIVINTLLLCTQGHIQFAANGKSVTVSQGQIFMCPPNTYLADTMVSIDFECKALCLTNRIIQALIRPYIGIWNSIVYGPAPIIYDLDDIDMLFVARLFDIVKLSLDHKRTKYRKDVIHSLIRGALIGLCGFTGDGRQVSEESVFTKDLFQRFLDLLQRSEVKHRSVKSYAAQLNISSKYLAVTCKKNSGRTALSWIDEYTMSDAVYYLQSTSLSIKEVSNKMGFPNPSFFGRYFRLHKGVSPLAFRKRCQAQSKTEPAE